MFFSFLFHSLSLTYVSFLLMLIKCICSLFYFSRNIFRTYQFSLSYLKRYFNHGIQANIQIQSNFSFVTYSRYFLFTNRGDHNILRCNFCLSCHNILDLSSIRICKFFCFYYDIRRVCVNTYNRFRKSF